MSERLVSAPLEVPVALVIFNRPDLTAEVFAAIREARPRRLIVIADGPRNEAEGRRCEAARAVIQVDWECELTKHFASTNLGCKTRVSSGIDAIFAEHNQAIILEDDCLPSRSFFPFCQTLLTHYRDDERVMCIGGLNLFAGNAARAGESYYFSRYGATNGWATWRRAWRAYDVGMSDWPRFRRSGGMRDLFPRREERWFWTEMFDAQFSGHIDTWDFQWLYARLVQSGLTAAPWTNMVANLGFRSDATHMSEMPQVWWPAKTRREAWEIEHPRVVLPNRDVDDYYYGRIFNSLGTVGIALSRARRLWARLHQRAPAGAA